jgi:hypothetical protein
LGGKLGDNKETDGKEAAGATAEDEDPINHEANRKKRAQDFSNLIAGGGSRAKSFQEVDEKL